jgi:hypothetical protein
MTLEKYSEMLKSIADSDEPFRDGDYVSDKTVIVGYWAQYKIGEEWLWFSVSDTSGSIVLPSRVAQAIAGGECQRADSFKRNGFEATVNFDGHYYMLGIGSKRPRLK